MRYLIFIPVMTLIGLILSATATTLLNSDMWFGVAKYFMGALSIEGCVVILILGTMLVRTFRGAK
jgi:hypothetical protein